jgi:hypothetical protein
MIAGSFASNVHGHYRSTNDVDIVIDVDERRLKEFVQLVSAQFYADLISAMEAFKQKSMFNIIDFATGYKADLIICKQRDFSRVEFHRRCRARIGEIDAWTASPEDTILAKLEWAKMRQSERQYKDTFHIAGVRGDTLDQSYLRKWAIELKVEEWLNRLFVEAGLLDKP